MVSAQHAPPRERTELRRMYPSAIARSPLSWRFSAALSRSALSKRAFSSAPSDSEALHGKLAEHDVSSKAMRRKLRAQAPPPPALAPPPGSPPQLAPQPPPGAGDGSAPSFGSWFLVTAAQGAGITLAFMLVFGALQSVFGGGKRAPAQPAEPRPRTGSVGV